MEGHPVNKSVVDKHCGRFHLPVDCPVSKIDRLVFPDYGLGRSVLDVGYLGHLHISVTVDEEGSAPAGIFGK